MWVASQMLGSVGSAVLTFIGYKETKQTDEQSLLIEREPDNFGIRGRLLDLNYDSK